MADEPLTPERVAEVRERTRALSGRAAAKRELAAAVRALLEQLPWADLDESASRSFAGNFREAARALAAAQADRSGEAGSADLFPGMANFQERSPIVGLGNPLAPPFEFSIDSEARVVRGHGRFGAAYEGGPGVVHGGFLSAVLDELLGMATVFSGRPGVTGELTVRYKHPTPTHTDLELEGRLDSAAGRRLQVSAEIRADGRVTVAASGLFVQVDDAHFESLDQERRQRDR